MGKYQIKSNLSEKQIEADVASFFGWISKYAPFRLLDIDERITGADKKFFDSGFAFFMQFKVSNGLESVDKVPLSSRRNRSKLEDIREYRAGNGLDDEPTLYFELRKKAKNASDYQHNLLMNYANKHCSQSFYVAPLHLDKTAYFNSLFGSVNRFRSHPFSYYNRRVFHRNWVSYIGHIPFLKEHISIIPHERVYTHKHYYSYSTTGFDIAWHSPELLSEKPSRLGDVLPEHINKCIDEEMFVDFEEIEKMMKENQIDSGFGDVNPIERIQKRGRYIYKKYGIRLILLLANKEHTNQLKENT